MSTFEKSVTRYGWITGGILLAIAFAIGLALVLPPREKTLDFVTMYAANLGIVHRVPIYDTPALTQLMIDQLNLQVDFKLYPHPYPPWYALSTFFLGFLRPQQAANAWMLLNVAMLSVCAALWTMRWKPLPRILAILATLMFIPAVGLIVVGQYSALLLLGATLFLYAAHRDDAPLTALALLLFTFKPHLGLFLFPGCFLWLILQKTPFARQAIGLTLAGGILLFALGFLADPAWPMSYMRALLEYTTVQGISDLGISAGFSAMLIKLIFGQGSAVWATWLSVGFVLILLTLFWRFTIFATPEILVSGCILLTLLGDPYLLNYDYILLLLPLAFLLREVKQPLSKAALRVVYFVPWLSLILERNANIFYAICAILLLILLLHHSHNRQKLVPN